MNRISNSPKVLVACLAALLAVGLTTESLAQINPGRLDGTLVDEEGNPVAGVKLRLMPQEQGSAQPKIVKTNKKGRFSVPFLPAGNWKVEAESEEHFLKSMHYTHRDGSGLKTGDFERDGHPTQGLPSFSVGVNGKGNLDLVLAESGTRARMVKQIKLQEVAGPLKRALEKYQAGEMEEAIKEASAIIAETPDLEQAYYLRGAAYWQNRNYAAAAPDLRKALAGDTELPQIHGLLGTALVEIAKAGDPAAAAPLYEEAADLMAEEVRHSPDDPAVRLNYVVALDAAGREEELEGALVALIEVEPDNTDAVGRLARLYASQERYDDALALIDRMADDDPSVPEILYNVAVAFYNASDYERANEFAAKVLEKRPDHVMTQRLLGYLKLAGGDQEGALAAFRTYVERAGDDGTQVERDLIVALEKQIAAGS